MKRKLFFIFPILMACALLFSLTPSYTVEAVGGGVGAGEAINEYQENQEAEEEDSGLGKDNLDKGTATRSVYADEDEKFYYRLEAVMPEKDKSKWFNLPGKTADAVSSAIHEAVMVLNRVIFNFNIMLSKLGIGMLEISMGIPFINDAIDKISSKTSDLVGISGTRFSSDGMFHPLIKIIALIVIVYSFYQLVWKRSFISSLGELLKFIIVLTVALLLFGNYGTFLTNVNKASDEIGGFIVGSTTSTTFSQTLWTHFIDKPYLTMQYGTDDVDVIGDGDKDAGIERIKELLKARIGSNERADVVSKEANDLENYYMTYDSVNEKTTLNLMFLFLNIITLIPFFIISIAIIFTQFWFVIIAIFAPFALLIASFPSQFGVLKRYFFELGLPLIVKIGLHFVLVMIMLLTSLVTEFETEFYSDMIDGHIGKAFINGIFYTMLFLGVFILRKRITGILSSGSEMMEHIREGMRATTTKPAQSAVQTATTVGGAVAGGVVGGAAGAAMGANIGSTLGKVATGQADGVAGATEDISRATYQYEMVDQMKQREEKAKQREEEQRLRQEKMDEEREYAKLSPEQKRALEHEEVTHAENMEKGLKSFDEFAESHGMSELESSRLMNELEAKGIDFSKVDTESLQQADIRGYDANGNPITGLSTKDPKQFADKLKENQTIKLAEEQEFKQMKLDKFNEFMEDRNLTKAEISDVHKHLELKAIDVASIPETDYIDADKEVRERLQQGESISYTDEFKKTLEHKAIERKIQEEKDRILGDDE